MVSEKNGN